MHNQRLVVEARLAKFVFRYFFDVGSGVCLWSGNDFARRQYGYPVDHTTLPLSQNLKIKAWYLVAWFDTSINWEYPLDPSPWSAEERKRFSTVSSQFLSQLCKELGAEYEIIDESGRLSSLMR